MKFEGATGCAILVHLFRAARGKLMNYLSARLTGRLAALFVPLLFLAACGDVKEEAREEPVRGLKVFEVSATADNMVRRYPSVIQPADESRLSFEIAGQLTEMTLEVGQEVEAGQELLTLDPTTLRYEVQQAEAEMIYKVFTSINEANPTREVLQVKYLEALEKVSDGQSNTLILPYESAAFLGALAGSVRTIQSRPQKDGE